MSVHGPLIFVLLTDKRVESTHVSKPVSTHTVHKEGVDGGNKKKKIRSPTILPLFPRVSLRKFLSTTKNAVYLKVKNKRDHYTFLGKLPTYPSPKPTLTLTSHLGQNVGLGEG